MKMQFGSAWLIALASCLPASVFSAEGSSSPYVDAIGDIDPNITTANGTLDIVGMEVSNTLTDISFKLTVNGNVATTDWAKYMIGIATGKNDGTMTGNGWGRPINLSLDNDPTSTLIAGMDFWVGSWVNGSSAQAAVGGSELYSYAVTGTSWSRLGATWDAGTYPYAYTVTAGVQSTIEWAFPLSVLGLDSYDTFYFDVYSSGGGGGDSAIDSLANPNVSVTDWGGPYTSYSVYAGGPGLNRYSQPLVPSQMTWAASGTIPGGNGVWGGYGYPYTNWIVPEDNDGNRYQWWGGSRAIFTGTIPTSSVDVVPDGIGAARGISFLTNGYTITGGAIRLGGTDSWSSNDVLVSAGVSATINSSIEASSGLTKSGGGSLVVGGTISGGEVLVSQGKLVIGPTGLIRPTAPAGVTVGANLSGAGVIEGAVRVLPGGTIAPGANIESLAVGSVTFSGSSTFAWEYDSTNPGSLGSAADLLVVSGNLSLDPTNATLLTLSDLSSSPKAFMDRFALINYGGTWNGGLFKYGGNVLADGSRFTVAGQEWEIDYNALTGGVNFTSDYLASGRFVTMTVASAPRVTINIASGTQAQGAAGYPLLTPVNAASVTKIGNGTVIFDAANTYTGTTNVNQGTLLVSNSAALQATPITVQTGGRLSINAVGTMQAPSLTLTGSGQVILPIATRQVVSLGSLAIDQASGGKLDIGKGRVEIAPGGITEAELRADLIAGRGTGNFSATNSGIVTSAENPSPMFIPAVGYRVFTTGSAIVAWSAFGDANLDGQVNSTDISLINSDGKYGKAGSAAAWWQGDFNYDGIVNSTDISLINASGLYGTGSYLPPLPPAPLVLTSVPEPSTWVTALAGLTCTAWVASRRRGNR